MRKRTYAIFPNYYLVIIIMNIITLIMICNIIIINIIIVPKTYYFLCGRQFYKSFSPYRESIR